MLSDRAQLSDHAVREKPGHHGPGFVHAEFVVDYSLTVSEVQVPSTQRWLVLPSALTT